MTSSSETQTPKTNTKPWRVDLEWGEMLQVRGGGVGPDRRSFVKTYWFDYEPEARNFVSAMRAEPASWLPVGGFDGIVNDPVHVSKRAPS